MRRKVTIPAGAEALAEELFDQMDVADYADRDGYYNLDELAELMFDEWIDTAPSGETFVNHTVEWFVDVLIWQTKVLFKDNVYLNRSFRTRLKWSWKNVREAFVSLRTYGEFTLNADQLRHLNWEYAECMEDRISDYRYDSDPRNHPSLTAAQRNR